MHQGIQMTYDPNKPPAGQYPQWPNPQQPQYAPPPAMLAYGMPTQNPRPTAATVLSIIGIVLGSFWILAGLGGIFQLFFTIGLMRTAMPGGMGGVEAVLKMAAFQSILGGFIGIALLTVSIGCLRLASWARTGIVIVAIIDLVFNLAKLIITLAWTIPAQQNAVANFAPTAAPTPAFGPISSSMTSAQMAIAVGMTIFMSAYPVIVLILMTKPRMKQAFERQPYQYP